jgi:small GTP-binding protein
LISRKICLLGAFSVGKSSLVRRFVHEVYDDRYVTTLGVKIETKLIELENEAVKLIIWDMEGADPSDKDAGLVTPRMKAYLQGVNGVLIVADGTRLLTVDVAIELLQWLRAEFPGVHAALLLNKSDLVDEWEVSEQRFAELSETLHCFTSSALSGDNVESTFEYLAQVLSDTR